METHGEKFTDEETQEYIRCVQAMKNYHKDQLSSVSVNQNGLEGHKMLETPDYYASQNGSGIKAIDAIASMGHMEGFCIGNILKYLWRAGKKKGQYLEDLYKALHYLQMLIDYVDKEYE
jgi:hypothetical protein